MFETGPRQLARRHTPSRSCALLWRPNSAPPDKALPADRRRARHGQLVADEPSSASLSMSVSHGLAGRSDFDKVATADSQLDAICASRWIGLDLVLPKPDDRPAAPAEATEVFGVPSHIPLDLLAPVGSQTISPLVEPPPVPEVAVD